MRQRFSSGGGRNVAFIAIDICLDQINSEQTLDILHLVLSLKHDRPGLVRSDVSPTKQGHYLETDYQFFKLVLFSNSILNGSHVHSSGKDGDGSGPTEHSHFSAFVPRQSQETHRL